MTSVKIARRGIRRATQTALAEFAEDVFKRMNDMAAYQELQPYVQALSPLLDAYRQALLAARNRGRMEVLAKNLAYAALLQELDILAVALELAAAGDQQMLVGAGFPIRFTGRTVFEGKLPKPVILRAGSTGHRGEVRIRVDDQVAARVVTNHALEYSLDRQHGWQKGTHHSHRNFVAANLPAASELWLRIKSLGRGGKQSEWSEPVIVGVL